MPSPVSARRIGEWALRVLSLAILTVILMRAWDFRRGVGAAAVARQGSINASLAEWSRLTPVAVHLDLDSTLAPVQRDWLAAIRRAGSGLNWSGSGIPATAATLNAVADPAGTSEVAIAAPAGSMMVVGDRHGPIDSVVAGAGGSRIEIPGNTRRLHVAVRGSMANIVAPDSIEYKRLLVEGAAGWETKFTVAALTERGWHVDALAHVAPGIDVRAGAPASPDTSRYAAVVAIDSTATLIAKSASSFVRSGGGLVTLRDAAGVGPVAASSVILERHADGDVRASRVGNGRIIRVSYKDLWRHRMTDDDTVADPVAAHRALLARLVASVAYAPRIALKDNSPSDPAPLADMVRSIGAPSSAVDTGSALRREVPSPVLFAVLLALLLLELLSRRLRGAR